MNVLNRLLSFPSAIRTDLTFDSLVESFHGKVKLCRITLDKLMLYYFAVINKDVTTEEVQRVEDLVTYLEEQNTETGLEKQVLLLCRFTASHVRILLIVVVLEHAVISYFVNPLSGQEFNRYFCAIFFCMGTSMASSFKSLTFGENFTCISCLRRIVVFFLFSDCGLYLSNGFDFDFYLF